MDTEKTPPPAVEPWHRSRMLLRNPVSLAGVALGIVSVANIFIFFLIDQIATKPSPYIGILAYMVVRRLKRQKNINASKKLRTCTCASVFQSL